MLDSYFEKETPQSIRQMVAEDWAVALDGFPQWAIEKAVRWWKSADNDRRGKRPIEGDIQARCRVEMGAVEAAKIRLGLRKTQQEILSNSAPKVSADRAEAIMEEHGFTPKRFGGAAQ